MTVLQSFVLKINTKSHYNATELTDKFQSSKILNNKYKADRRKHLDKNTSENPITLIKNKTYWMIKSARNFMDNFSLPYALMSSARIFK